MKKLFILLLVSICYLAGFGQAFVDPLLSEELSRRNDDEQIQVIVVMKAQYNRMLLNRGADRFLTRADRREFVIHELKTFAEASQYDLRLRLSEMERHGMVSSPTVLWMANALCFNANKAAIADLVLRNDIALIGIALEQPCIPEVEATASAFLIGEIMPNVTQVRADQVWSRGYKGEGVVVAIIDSGVNYNHVDLVGHLWDGGEAFPHHGFDVYHHDDDPMDDHEYGHGTHCAGIVCGNGTAGRQTGMAPEATLMCVKCTNQSGYSNSANLSEGIQWAIEHGCDLFSLSTCLASPSLTDRVLLRHVCESALDAGIVAAIAAGNEGDKQDRYPIPNNVRLPGSCPPPYMDEMQGEQPGGLSCAVCVGAVDYDDQAAVFTSNGPSAWANTESEFCDYPYNPGIGLIRPDVCAPGVDIWSLNFESNTGYRPMSGSSMAAPCVAGIMALMMSRDHNLTPADICRILEETAVPLAEGKSNIYGFGRVDALAAIDAVPLGGIRYQSYTLNDADGNNDHRLNPGEMVYMSLTLNNIFDAPIGGVSVVLESEDEHLTLMQDSVAFPEFAAFDTLTMEDAFSFKVDNQVVANQIIKFVLKLYVDGELMAVYNNKMVVYDYLLELGDFIVMNDGNGNGLLEPGETADLRLLVENKGNETSPQVEAILSTEHPLVTLVETTKPLARLEAGCTGYVDFRVTLDAAATLDMALPFVLDLEDADERHTLLPFDYRSACKVIFTLRDSFNDGWQDNYLQVDYTDGTPSEQMTLNEGGLAVIVREPIHNSTVTISWHNASWSQECSFEIAYEDGTVIFQNTGGFSEAMTFLVDCANGFGVDDSVEPEQQVSIFPNPTSGTVTIRCQGMTQVEVYSLDGKLVQRIVVNGDTCQLDGLEHGIYLVRITESEGTLVRKVVKW